MLSYIHKVLRKRELKQLLALIAKEFPELDDYDGKTKLCHYLTRAVAEFTQVMKNVDEGILPSDPQMSELLVRSLRYWTTHQATTYAFMVIQNQNEIARLEQLVEAYEKMTDLYQGREGFVLNLAEAATKAVKSLNESTLPNNRLN